MRLALAIAFLVSMAVSAFAADRLYSLDDMVILSDDELMRAVEQYTMRMYHPRCRCYAYMRGDHVEALELPVDDVTRLKLLRDMLQGQIKPLLRDAPES